MSTADLERFVEEANIWRNFSKKPKPKLDVYGLSEDDLRELKESVDCKLSPENLCCDGELSRAEVDRKYRYLTSVMKEIDNRLIQFKPKKKM